MEIELFLLFRCPEVSPAPSFSWFIYLIKCLEHILMPGTELVPPGSLGQTDVALKLWGIDNV